MKRCVKIISSLLMSALPVISVAQMTNDMAGCGPKAENIGFLIDISGSMQKPIEEGEQKIYPTHLAVELAEKIVSRVYEKSFDWGVYTTCPYTTVLPYGKHEPQIINSKLSDLKNPLEIFGRRSPLGFAVAMHGVDLQKLGSSSAVILMTDGENNRGRDLPQSVRKLLSSSPKSCLHIVSFAKTDEGLKAIKDLTSISSCTVIQTAEQLLHNEEALDDFIENSLYKECLKAFSLTGINFAFDRFNIDSSSEPTLKKALEALSTLQDHQKVEIHGWTDYMGSEKYNLELSKKRAESVKAWLVSRGINASRIETFGHGKSYLYDNHTTEGRYNNRRIDFRVINIDRKKQ